MGGRTANFPTRKHRKKVFIFPCSLPQFRRRVAKALICNEHLSAQPARPSKRKRDGNSDHELQAAPPHAPSFCCRKMDLYLS
jgi:hypothetical protein